MLYFLHCECTTTEITLEALTYINGWVVSPRQRVMGGVGVATPRVPTPALIEEVGHYGARCNAHI